MIRKSWNDNRIRGDKTLRSYRDYFWNHPYQRIVYSLRDGWPKEWGELRAQKHERYGYKHVVVRGNYRMDMHTWLSNSAHFHAPAYSFYNAIDVTVYGLDFQLWYSVNFYDQKYSLEIRPNFHFRHKFNVFNATLPLSLRMNEDSITAFAIQEIKKVFLPPGLFLDLQLSAGLSIEALKETLKSYSLTAAVKKELADRNYDNYIQRRLRKKQNIIASEYLGTNTLLDLLHHKSGKRFKERQITVTMKDIFDSLQDFDGDVDELEIELSNQMENKILV